MSTSSDTPRNRPLVDALDLTMDAWDDALAACRHPGITIREVGRILEIGSGIARVDGLPRVRFGELVRFRGNRLALAFDLGPDEVGLVLLDPAEDLETGDRGYRTERVLDVPVGEDVIGRVIDPNGRPLDGGGAVSASDRYPAERPAPGIMDRAPVDTPLQTGIKVIDALIPIGRGQRELIVGDRQTGRTAISVDTILNQDDQNVVSIYCAIGQRSAAVAGVVRDLREHGAMDHTVVVATTGEDPAGLQYIAPYAATAMGEYLMHQGRDVLVVYDDLTHHARAYRELSLLLRRPPGREAYPGDIFYIHSRLLERATHLRDEEGGGSLTALPIVETQAQNISAYIPTNLISITDGQIYLSPRLFQQGHMPAVDVGRSVSRVDGDAQLPAYRTVTGDLRLAYSQFEELERFSRYGARLEEQQRRSLEHGRRVREVFRQAQYEPLPVEEQIAALIAVNRGLFDQVPPDRVEELERTLRKHLADELGELMQSVRAGEPLSDEQRDTLLERAAGFVLDHTKSTPHGNPPDTAPTD